jgi:hypothetical protein
MRPWQERHRGQVRNRSPGRDENRAGRAEAFRSAISLYSCSCSSSTSRFPCVSKKPALFFSHFTQSSPCALPFLPRRPLSRARSLATGLGSSGLALWAGRTRRTVLHCTITARTVCSGWLFSTRPRTRFRTGRWAADRAPGLPGPTSSTRTGRTVAAGGSRRAPPPDAAFPHTSHATGRRNRPGRGGGEHAREPPARDFDSGQGGSTPWGGYPVLPSGGASARRCGPVPRMAQRAPRTDQASQLWHKERMCLSPVDALARAARGVQVIKIYFHWKIQTFKVGTQLYS